jgi:glycine/D-amino acid oxidase-like deaminating enzyme
MNLARRGIQVTVLERGSSKETGVTTPASWAWLNANQKDPPHYRWLNQLGMLSWRRDKALRKYPVWSGSLVQYKEQPKASRLAGYEHEGPLDSERLLELEPHATFSDGPVYYFPGEGYVDPAEAVTAMRQIASDKGATFLFEHNATKLLYNDKDSTKQRVCGVVCTSMNSGGNEAASSRIMADVVVITCGAGDSSTDLGGVPLADRPGCLAFAKPRSADASPRLSRLLIDTVNAAHVQQRQDGTIAMGGGTLELGGSSLAPRTTCSAATTVSHHYGQDDQNPLLAGAHRIAPSVVKHTAYSHSASAVRPFPKDGLPVTGYSKPGLYSIVTHSGVTLAPILGALAAAEIVDGTDLDILRPYRRTRFAFS